LDGGLGGKSRSTGTPRASASLWIVRGWGLLRLSFSMWLTVTSSNSAFSASCFWVSPALTRSHLSSAPVVAEAISSITHSLLCCPRWYGTARSSKIQVYSIKSVTSIATICCKLHMWGAMLRPGEVSPCSPRHKILQGVAEHLSNLRVTRVSRPHVNPHPTRKPGATHVVGEEALLIDFPIIARPVVGWAQ